jgi:hypothetical protein
MSQLNLNFGSQVHCLDGHHGKLEGVVVNPVTMHITGLLMQTGFLIGKHAWVLPLATVKSASPETIELVITSDEFKQYPQYRLVEYEEPDTSLIRQTGGTAGGSFNTYSPYGAADPVVPMVKKKFREGIAAGDKVITHKTHLKNVEETVGNVVQVQADQYSEIITSLTVQQGLLFATGQLSIPMSVVTDVDNEAVYTTRTEEELADLGHNMHQV